MRRNSILVLILLLGVSFFTNCKEERDIVAKVGSLVITKEEFISELKIVYPHITNTQDISFEKKEKVLDRIIIKKQKVNAALDIDLDEDMDFKNDVKNYENRLIGNKYYEIFIIDKLVPKEEVSDYLERQGTELKATHILVGHDKSNAKIKRTRDEAQILANKIANEAKEGADFTELVEKYSDDPSAKKNKGDLSYFTWGKMTQPFQEAAWKLTVGEISYPVETQYGFHIIRLDDRRENPDYVPPTDNESIFRVKERLYQTRADSGRKLWNTHFQNLKEKYSYRLDKNNIDSLSAMLSKKLKGQKIDQDSFSKEELSTALAVWNGSKIVFQDLLNKYKKDLSRILVRFRNPGVLQREIEGLSTLELVVTDAKKYKINEDKDILQQTNKFLETQLARLVENKEINEKVIITDEDALKYYQENPDKFKKAPEIELWEIYVKDENQAKNLLTMAKAGQDFEELARKYSQDKTYASRGGYLGFRQIKARGAVSQRAFELGLGGKIGGPIKYRNGWTIFKTGEKHDETIKVFENVKRLAESHLRNERIREKRVQWEEQIKEEYPAVIYNERITEI